MLESQRHALEVRARLHRPSNAVHDHGIDLKRPRPALAPCEEPETPLIAAPATTEREQKQAEMAELLKQLQSLQVRMAALRAECGTNDWCPKIRDIQDACCLHFGVARRDLLSKRRDALVVVPRHIGMYLCRMLTLHSLPEISRLFGGRDHSTALNAIRKITVRRERDPILDRHILSLEVILLGKAS